MNADPLRWCFSLAMLLLAFAYAANAGAATVPSQWTSRGIGAGGALMDPSFSPHDDRLFVACDMSELFRSEDLGRHWQAVHFGEIQGNRGTRVGFTSSADLMYAIDQTGELPVPALSHDGGVTWSRVANAIWPEDRTAYALFVDGASTQRLLVGTYDALWISVDGGASFQQRYATASGNGLYLAGAFFDGSTIRVGSSDGLLVSTNGGGSFALQAMPGFPANSGIASFAGARENGQTRLFASAALRADLYPGILIEELFLAEFPGLWRLDPGQTAWTAANAGVNAEDRPLLVGMATNDIDAVYAAGAADPDQGEAPIVYRSSNGGSSFSSVLHIENNQNIATGWAGDGGDRGWSYGGGLIGFAVAPNNPLRLATSDYGFVHVSEDGGAHWRQVYVDAATQNPENAATPIGRSYRSVGIENTSVWSLAWSDATHLFAGFSDIRGIRSADGGQSWSFDYSGHTHNSMYRVARHSDGSLYAATSSAHDLYQSTYLQDSRIDGASGRLLRSSNHGQTWMPIHDFGHALTWVALDPGNAQRAYVAVAHSVDGGVWVRRRPGRVCPRRRAPKVTPTTSCRSMTAASSPAIRGGAAVPAHSPRVRGCSTSPAWLRPGRTAALPACITGPRTSSSIRTMPPRTPGTRRCSRAGVVRRTDWAASIAARTVARTGPASAISIASNPSLFIPMMPALPISRRKPKACGPAMISTCRRRRCGATWPTHSGSPCAYSSTPSTRARSG
jgi:hypothetical protein